MAGSRMSNCCRFARYLDAKVCHARPSVILRCQSQELLALRVICTETAGCLLACKPKANNWKLSTARSSGQETSTEYPPRLMLSVCGALVSIDRRKNGPNY